MSKPRPELDPDRDAATRRLLAVVSLAGFASALATRFFDPMVVVIARDLGSEPARIALLASAFALPYALIQPVAGPIGDALGKERIMAICLAFLALALASCALAPSEPILFAARVLSGAAGGGIIPLALATIGDRVPMAERQVAISRFLLFTLSGQLLGGTLAGLLSGFLGWRGVVGIAAAIALSAFAALYLRLRSGAPQTGRFTFGVALERYGRILGIGRARALFIFVFVEGIVIFGMFPYVAPLLELRLAGGAFEAGLILAAFALGGVTYTLIVGWLLRVFGVGRMLVFAGILVGAAYAAVGTVAPWQAQAALFFAIGCGFYMLHNSYQTQVTEVVSDARGSAVSLHAFAFFCGQALGPVVVGAALGSLGLVATAYLCGFGALVLGIASSRILFPRQPRPL